MSLGRDFNIYISKSVSLVSSLGKGFQECSTCRYSKVENQIINIKDEIKVYHMWNLRCGP